MTIYDCFIYLPAKLETLFDIHKFSEGFFCKEVFSHCSFIVYSTNNKGKNRRNNTDHYYWL